MATLEITKPESPFITCGEFEPVVNNYSSTSHPFQSQQVQQQNDQSKEKENNTQPQILLEGDSHHLRDPQDEFGTSLLTLRQSVLNALQSILTEMTLSNSSTKVNSSTQSDDVIAYVTERADQLAAVGKEDTTTSHLEFIQEGLIRSPSPAGVDSPIAKLMAISTTLNSVEIPNQETQINLARLLSKLLIDLTLLFGPDMKLVDTPKSGSPGCSTPINGSSNVDSETTLETLCENVESARKLKTGKEEDDGGYVWSEIEKIFDEIIRQHKEILSRTITNELEETPSEATTAVSTTDPERSKEGIEKSKQPLSGYSDLPPHYIEHLQDRKLVNSSTPNNRSMSILSPSMCELSTLIDSIEHVQRVLPSLDNQRVRLSKKKLDELSVAALCKAIERLQKPSGKMTEQRACLKPHGDDLLISRIEALASRSLVDQRADLLPEPALRDTLQKLMEMNGGRLEQQRASFTK